MLGVACNGKQGFRKVWDLVIENGSAQFGTELHHLLPLLKEIYASSTTTWRRIGPIVEMMLIAEPSRRPDSKTIEQLLVALSPAQTPFQQKTNRGRRVSGLNPMTPTHRLWTQITG
jgi:hypothetical protein